MIDSKVRENRLRRMAQRQGIILRKSRRRDPRAIDFGMWYVVNPTALTKHRGGQGMTIDEIEIYLTGDGE